MRAQKRDREEQKEGERLAGTLGNRERAGVVGQAFTCSHILKHLMADDAPARSLGG